MTMRNQASMPSQPARGSAAQSRLAIAGLTLLLPMLCSAGSLEQADWQARNCGTKPKLEPLQLNTVDAYNKSVGIINSYRQATRSYVECVIQEANADIQRITSAATNTRNDAAAVDEDITVQLKAADAKLGK